MHLRLVTVTLSYVYVTWCYVSLQYPLPPTFGQVKNWANHTLPSIFNCSLTRHGTNFYYFDNVGKKLLTLLAFFFFHTYNTFTHFYILEHSPRLLSISSSLISSVADTSLGCRVGIRTRARLTASRHATNWAMPHPNWAMAQLLCFNHSAKKIVNEKT